MGNYTQPLGPYPMLSAGGYGDPAGYKVGTLGNPTLATQQGMVMLHDMAANKPSQMWNFQDPLTIPVSLEDAQKVHDYMAKQDYLKAPKSASRLHSSTFGNVATDESGYVSYSGMNKHIPSYGHYSRQ
jgi:hypothetical protein